MNQNRWNQQGGAGQRIVLPNSSNLSSLAISGVKTFAKRNKVITGSYLFGLLIIILGGSGYKLSNEQAIAYNQIMSTIDLQAEFDASNKYASSLQAYRATKGWFFSCDSLCQRNKNRMEYAKRDLDMIRAEGYNRMSDAKATAGIFSEIGVGEVKDSFWEYFQSGKQFAKRQSMWDAMFMGMRSMGRDESMMEYVLKVLMNALINFSLGLIMAFFIFVFGLWSIVKSYQPDPITAVAFFLTASCAAFAFVSTFLFVMYGAAAGSVYGVAKLAEANMRIDQGQGGGQRRPMQNRPHHS